MEIESPLVGPTRILEEQDDVLSRSYKQYCPLAKSLDVVGDRWTLLIVRNLLLGPLRYSELQSSLPGIATNLLATRLQHLSLHGVLACNEQGEYVLSSVGAELEPILFSLSEWGERHVFGAREAEDTLHYRFLLTSLRRKIKPTAEQVSILLDIEGRHYALVCGPSPYVAQSMLESPSLIERFDKKQALLAIISRLQQPVIDSPWAVVARAIG